MAEKYGTNDPTKISAIKFADRTDAQRLDNIERAKALAIADGGGIAILPEITVISLLEQADAARVAAAKSKGEAQFTDAELTFIRDAKAAFGKKTTLAGEGGKKRSEFAKTYGVAKYEAEMKRWSATADVRKPGTSPYRGIKGLKKALRGTEEDTEFNRQILNPDRIAPPPKVKISKEQRRDNPWIADSWNVTRQGEIYKTLGADVAGRMAAAAGLKIGATRPVR